MSLPPTENAIATTPRPGPVRRLYDWTLSLAERRGSGGWLALLSFAEASFFPIPPDVMLIPLCLGSAKKAVRFATICSLASIAGGMAGYAIGHYVWQSVDQFFFNVVPGFSEHKFSKFEELYSEWGIAVVFLAGFSPIPFKVFTIASGVASMAFLPFVAAAAVSRSARFFIVALLLAFFGEPMKVYIDRHFNKLALLGSLLLVGGFAAIKLLF